MSAVRAACSILAHRETTGALHSYVALEKSEEWITGIDFSDPHNALAAVTAEFKDWAPELMALITDTDTDPLPRKIMALPVDHRWERVPGVTLLGDAAHLMSPFAGEGANLAMYDGAELAKAIVTAGGDIEGALSSYENPLFPRSASSASEAERNLGICFDNRAPLSLLELFAQYQTSAAR